MQSDGIKGANVSFSKVEEHAFELSTSRNKLTLTTSPLFTPSLSALLPLLTVATCAWKSSGSCRNVMPNRASPPERLPRNSSGNTTRQSLRNLISTTSTFPGVGMMT